MSQNVLKNPLYKPQVSREVYTQQAIERAFPSGEWIPSGSSSLVDQQRVGPTREEMRESKPAQPGPEGMNLTVIGGTKYDQEALKFFMDSQRADVQLVTGGESGAERDLRGFWDEAKSPPLQIPIRKNYYLKGEKRFNVKEILSHDLDSPVLLVGSGQRIDWARDVLEKSPWPRKVYEI